MGQINKQLLLRANAAVAAGNYEEFLTFCTPETEWDFVGEQVLIGREAVRIYMSENYYKPPVFDVQEMIAEGDWLTVLGKITLSDRVGLLKSFRYCDIWKFRDGLLDKLRAFVVRLG